MVWHIWLIHTPCTKHNFVIGLSITLDLVCNFTERTWPILSGKTSRTLPKGHEPRGAAASITTTTSPMVKFLFFWVHLCLSWSRGKYSHTHHFQKMSAMYWTCLHRLFTYWSWGPNTPGAKAGFPFNNSRWLGVSGSKSRGSSDSWVIGRSFKIDSTSQSTVCNPSSSKVCWRRTELRTLRISRIIRSHIPP